MDVKRTKWNPVLDLEDLIAIYLNDDLNFVHEKYKQQQQIVAASSLPAGSHIDDIDSLLVDSELTEFAVSQDTTTSVQKPTQQSSHVTDRGLILNVTVNFHPGTALAAPQLIGEHTEKNEVTEVTHEQLTKKIWTFDSSLVNDYISYNNSDDVTDFSVQQPVDYSCYSVDSGFQSELSHDASNFSPSASLSHVDEEILDPDNHNHLKDEGISIIRPTRRFTSEELVKQAEIRKWASNFFDGSEQTHEGGMENFDRLALEPMLTMDLEEVLSKGDNISARNFVKDEKVSNSTSIQRFTSAELAKHAEIRKWASKFFDGRTTEQTGEENMGNFDRLESMLTMDFEEVLAKEDNMSTRNHTTRRFGSNDLIKHAEIRKWASNFFDNITSELVDKNPQNFNMFALRSRCKTDFKELTAD